jgi:hypothetical protein
MKGVASGAKNTVGGTVVATERGLNAVEPIQYSGIMLITSSASAATIAARFHQREALD